MLPAIPNKPGVSNWVEKAGGLPSLIERVARHLQAKGRTVGAAIATAVNWAKKMCATGRAFGGKVPVGARAKAAACRAVASWEAKKASGSAQEAVFAEVDALLEASADEDDLTVEDLLPLMVNARGRLVVAEGLVDSYWHKSALRESFIGQLFPDGEPDDLREALLEEVAADRLLVELLDGAEELGLLVEAADQPKQRGGQKSVSSEFEKKHPRAAKGRVGGGQWIQKGSSGAEVKGLQRELGIAKPTNKFDGKTEAALRTWQAEQGLQVDGIAGAQTVARMQDGEAAPGALTSKDRSFLASRADDEDYTRQRRKAGTLAEASLLEAGAPLRKGAREPQRVQQLQNRLAAVGHQVKSDGDFGPRTEKAVRELQSKRGLSPDGVVADRTISELRRPTPEEGEPSEEPADAGPSPSPPVADQSAPEREWATHVGVAPTPAGSPAQARKGADTLHKGVGVPGRPDNRVREIQQALADAGFEPAGGSDGRFGPRTEEKVKALQDEQGLRADGIVDKPTRRVMKRLARGKRQSGSKVEEADSKADSKADGSEDHRKLKCPKCDAVQSAAKPKCASCGHDLAKARRAKFAKLAQESQVAEATDLHERAVNAMAISSKRRERLIDRGWAGDPTDSRERLYAPGHRRNPSGGDSATRGTQRGDSGGQVRKLQRAIGAKPDGDFGQQTERKLKDFQRSHGLKPDGQAGKKTWKKLTGINDSGKSSGAWWKKSGVNEAAELEEGVGRRAIAQIKRLPDGTFAPAGRGRVLRPGDNVLIPHKSGTGNVRGRVTSRAVLPPHVRAGTTPKQRKDLAVQRVAIEDGPDKGQRISVEVPRARAGGKPGSGTGKKTPGTTDPEIEKLTKQIAGLRKEKDSKTNMADELQRSDRKAIDAEISALEDRIADIEYEGKQAATDLERDRAEDATVDDPRGRDAIGVARDEGRRKQREAARKATPPQGTSFDVGRYTVKRSGSGWDVRDSDGKLISSHDSMEDAQSAAGQRMSPGKKSPGTTGKLAAEDHRKLFPPPDHPKSPREVALGQKVTDLKKFEGQKVRLTYENGIQSTGLVTVKDSPRPGTVYFNGREAGGELDSLAKIAPQGSNKRYEKPAHDYGQTYDEWREANGVPKPSEVESGAAQLPGAKKSPGTTGALPRDSQGGAKALRDRPGESPSTISATDRFDRVGPPTPRQKRSYSPEEVERARRLTRARKEVTADLERRASKGKKSPGTTGQPVRLSKQSVTGKTYSTKVALDGRTRYTGKSNLGDRVEIEKGTHTWSFNRREGSKDWRLHGENEYGNYDGLVAGAKVEDANLKKLLDRTAGAGGKKSPGTTDGPPEVHPTVGKLGRGEMKVADVSDDEVAAVLKGLDENKRFLLRSKRSGYQDKGAQFARMASELRARQGGGAQDGSSSKKARGVHRVGGDVKKAAELLGKGEKVQLDQPKTASTLLDELAKRVKQAVEKGDAAPSFDLCDVSVPDTNLFCADSKGVPRVQMPQLKGVPTSGSAAAGKVDAKGEADLSDAFREHLAAKGFKVENGTERAAYLRATQNELNGGKVAGMVKAMQAGKEIKGAPLFVSRDDYIVDGHHRWAAEVGMDALDGTLGNDRDMKVQRIDADIITILDEANKFAADNGIPQAGVGQGPPGPPTKKSPGTTGDRGDPLVPPRLRDPETGQADPKKIAAERLGRKKNKTPKEVAQLARLTRELAAKRSLDTGSAGKKSPGTTGGDTNPDTVAAELQRKYPVRDFLGRGAEDRYRQDYEFALGWAKRLTPGKQVSAAGVTAGVVIVQNEDGTYQVRDNALDEEGVPSGWKDIGGPVQSVEQAAARAAKVGFERTSAKDYGDKKSPGTTGGTDDTFGEPPKVVQDEVDKINAGKPSPPRSPGDLEDNTDKIEMADLAPGTPIALKSGEEFFVHKSTDSGWVIVKPAAGGKAKPLNGKFAPSKIGKAPQFKVKDYGSMTSAEKRAAAATMGKAPPSDLESKLADSVAAAKSGDLKPSAKSAPSAASTGDMGGKVLSPARSASGNLRNFKAMGDAKLKALQRQMADSYDEEGREAVQAEFDRRAGVTTPKSSAPTFQAKLAQAEAGMDSITSGTEMVNLPRIDWTEEEMESLAQSIDYGGGQESMKALGALAQAKPEAFNNLSKVRLVKVGDDSENENYHYVAELARAALKRKGFNEDGSPLKSAPKSKSTLGSEKPKSAEAAALQAYLEAGGKDEATIAALSGGTGNQPATQAQQDKAQAKQEKAQQAGGTAAPLPEKGKGSAVLKPGEGIKAADFGSLAGKKVVITGTLGTMTRKQAEGRVGLKGGKLTSIDRTTPPDLLIVGDKAGSKLKKARAKGIPVMTWAEAQTLLEAMADSDASALFEVAFAEPADIDILLVESAWHATPA